MSVLMEGIVVLIVFTIISIVLLESMGDKIEIGARTINLKEIKKILKIFDYERVSYFKAKKVIDSCDSVSQVVPCRRYIEQFYKVFEDEQLYKRIFKPMEEKVPLVVYCLSYRCLLSVFK